MSFTHEGDSYQCQTSTLPHLTSLPVCCPWRNTDWNITLKDASRCSHGGLVLAVCFCIETASAFVIFEQARLHFARHCCPPLLEKRGSSLSSKALSGSSNIHHWIQQFFELYLPLPFPWQVLGRVEGVAVGFVSGHVGFWILRVNELGIMCQRRPLVKNIGLSKSKRIFCQEHIIFSRMQVFVETDVETLSTAWSVVVWFRHFPGSQFRLRTWIADLCWATELFWMFPFLGRRLMPPVSHSFSTQGAHRVAWQQHSTKIKDCFVAAGRRNPFPKPYDFCRSTSPVLSVFLCEQSVAVKSCRAPTFCQQK